MRLIEISKLIGAELHGSSDAAELEISAVAPIDRAESGSISFIASADYEKFLDQTQASAIICKKVYPKLKLPQLIHHHPYLAFAKIALQFFKPEHGFKGISEQAYVAESATLESDITLFPHVFIGPGAKIGRGAVIYPGVYVGAGAIVGTESILYPNVVIGDRCQIGSRVMIHAGTVIGADGFGFVKGEQEIVKIPQTGIVVIEDDVELGGLCTVDRATMGETRIKRGTKFDSKVHIAHNVEVGENCLFSALTGVAGSAKIGNWVTSGGNAGFNGHIEVGDGVTIGAKAGVTASLGAGGVYMGFPAVPAQQWRKQHVYIKRLPDYEKRVKELERRLAELEAGQSK